MEMMFFGAHVASIWCPRGVQVTLNTPLLKLRVKITQYFNRRARI